jgi:hypothetical protein
MLGDIDKLGLILGLLLTLGDIDGMMLGETEGIYSDLMDILVLVAWNNDA